MTRSASLRRSPSTSRSRCSPSSSRPLPCSGCGRRAASCRRTSTSSVASRNTSGGTPSGRPLGEVGVQGVEERAGADVDHDRDRLLAAAALVDQPDHVAQQARRQVVDDVEAEVLELLGRGAAAGAGHAGDDHQVAVRAVVRVMVPSSISPVAVLTRDSLAGLGGRRDRILDRGRGARPDAGHQRDLVDGGGAQLLQRAEVLEQRLAAHLAQPGHVVEQALDHRLRAPGAVVGDREPVRLVADPLQEVEALAGPRPG